jgi:hypothetical protein
VTTCGELQPGEGVDGHGIGLHVADVAESDVGGARREERADALAEAGQVAPRDRPVDGELEGARRIQGHRRFDRRGP